MFSNFEQRMYEMRRDIDAQVSRILMVSIEVNLPSLGFSHKDDAQSRVFIYTPLDVVSNGFVPINVYFRNVNS